MVELNYKEYAKEKTDFLREHGFKEVYTSQLEGTVYYKTYTCEDGAVWYERMERKTLYQDVSIKGIIVTASVDIQETEFWNSINSTSRVMYAKW